MRRKILRSHTYQLRRDYYAPNMVRQRRNFFFLAILCLQLINFHYLTYHGSLTSTLATQQSCYGLKKTMSWVSFPQKRWTWSHFWAVFASFLLCPILAKIFERIISLLNITESMIYFYKWNILWCWKLSQSNPVLLIQYSVFFRKLETFSFS